MAALLLAACGGEQAVPALPQASTTTVTSPPAEAGGLPERSEEERADVAEVLESAPDFTLQLGDESIFNLSAELRPVYLVFWAEW